VYGPPVDRDGPDVLGDDEDEYDEYHEDDEPAVGSRSLARAVTAPEALALASVVLAVVSLSGVGLLNGSPYLPQAFYDGGGAPDQSDLVLAVLLGAALTLLPVGLGVWALRGLPGDSPSRTTAGAGVLVALVSFALRLVLAARMAADERVPFVQF
jgi:hypothetical protein